MKVVVILLLSVLCIAGCAEKKIELTNEYIINPNWSRKGEEVGANTIEIRKMKVRKDSIIDPFADLGQAEILEKLEYDSSFIFFANVRIKPQESYESKRISFNEENDFYWLQKYNGHSKKRIVGKLKPYQWYEVAGLDYFSYVVYIDSSEKVHRYVINQVNY